MHFPAGALPPARYFWSITMYNLDLLLVPNPINRYAIGNRTSGIKYNADGSLDLYLQSTAPAGHRSNWLPSPASGQFEIVMRLYGPKRDQRHIHVSANRESGVGPGVGLRHRPRVTQARSGCDFGRRARVL